jgi:hypothetical protein
MIRPGRFRGPSFHGGTVRGVEVLRTCLEAISTAPRCEIRALVMHVYPDRIKAYGHERHTVYVGRRSKPVRKPR